MPSVEVDCSKCGAGEYRLVDKTTGEVMCLYCRNRWVVPELRTSNLPAREAPDAAQLRSLERARSMRLRYEAEQMLDEERSEKIHNVLISMIVVGAFLICLFSNLLFESCAVH